MTTAAGRKSAMTREVTITRVLDAPRSLVYRMWTDPRHLAQWWGPKSFTNPVCEVDLRPGGALRIVMRAPNGTDYPMNGTFREIVEPERLAFTTIATDQDGNALLEGVTTVTFAEQDGRTTITVHSRADGLVPIAERMLDGMEAGWTQSIEQLVELVRAS